MIFGGPRPHPGAGVPITSAKAWTRAVAMDSQSPITVAITRFEDLLALGLQAALAPDPSMSVVAQDIVPERIAVMLRAHRPQVLIVDLAALRDPVQVRRLQGRASRHAPRPDRGAPLGRRVRPAARLRRQRVPGPRRPGAATCDTPCTSGRVACKELQLMPIDARDTPVPGVPSDRARGRGAPAPAQGQVQCADRPRHFRSAWRPCARTPATSTASSACPRVGALALPGSDRRAAGGARRALPAATCPASSRHAVPGTTDLATRREDYRPTVSGTPAPMRRANQVMARVLAAHSHVTRRYRARCPGDCRCRAERSGPGPPSNSSKHLGAGAGGEGVRAAGVTRAERDGLLDEEVAPRRARRGRTDDRPRTAGRRGRSSRP